MSNRFLLLEILCNDKSTRSTIYCMTEGESIYDLVDWNYFKIMLMTIINSSCAYEVFTGRQRQWLHGVLRKAGPNWTMIVIEANVWRDSASRDYWERVEYCILSVLVRNMGRERASILVGGHRILRRKRYHGCYKDAAVVGELYCRTKTWMPIKKRN